MTAILHFVDGNRDLLNGIGIDGLLGLSAWIVVAGGRVPLGNAGFAALGAYASLLVAHRGMPVSVAAVLGAAIAGVCGYVASLVLARAGGAQFAIATLALGEAIVLFAHASAAGAAPARANPPASLPTIFIFIALAACTFALWRMMMSREGRALRSVAQDEEAAASLGISATRCRRWALCAGATVAGVAGVCAAFGGGAPPDFGPATSVVALAVAVVGGAGSVAGPALGAVVLGVVDHAVRPLALSRATVDALALLACAILAPGGAWSLVAGFRSRRSPEPASIR